MTEFAEGNGPLGCREALESFAAFLDGELDAREGALLEAHLESCRSCRAEAKEMAALDRDFSLLTVATELGLEGRVRAILAGTLRGGVVPTRSSSTRVRSVIPRWRRMLPQAILAASVLIAVGAAVAAFAAGYRRRIEEVEAERARLEAEREARENQLAREELERLEAARRRAYEDMKRREEERRLAEQRLKEIAEHERELARAYALAAEEQRRRELEERIRLAKAQAEEERRRAEEDLQRREEEELRAREELAEMERERMEAQARIRTPPKDLLVPKKPSEPPPKTPVAVAPLEAAPCRLEPSKVNVAIGRGVGFLKGRIDPILENVGEQRLLELVLWTLVHAGVSESDPDFQQLLKNMLVGPLERTYNVALQAMILEELHRVNYQLRIQQCAQFLVDNQCQNGQWSYGTPSLFARDIHTGLGRDMATLAARLPVREYVPDGPRLKPRVKTFVRVWKKREGPPTGDNSNSQYALLGLRSCHDAGVVLPPEVIRLAQKWWREAQHDDPRRDPSEGQGWGYGGRNQDRAYGSMTAGGVASLAICDYILREDWRRDRSLQKGLLWLARHFSVTENPHREGHPQWLYYYLYGLERAGVFTGVEKMGVHDWYARGALSLLETQQPDGSWPGGQPVQDACFAILFLRRATRPLVDVETGDTRSR